MTRIKTTLLALALVLTGVFAAVVPGPSTPKPPAHKAILTTSNWQVWGYYGWTLEYRIVGPANSTYVDYFQQRMQFNAATGTVRSILFRITGPNNRCYNQGHFEQIQSSACLVLLSAEANTLTQYLSGAWNYLPLGYYCAQFVLIGAPVTQRCAYVIQVVQA